MDNRLKKVVEVVWPVVSALRWLEISNNNAYLLCTMLELQKWLLDALISFLLTLMNT